MYHNFKYKQAIFEPKTFDKSSKVLKWAKEIEGRKKKAISELRRDDDSRKERARGNRVTNLDEISPAEMTNEVLQDFD